MKAKERVIFNICMIMINIFTFIVSPSLYLKIFTIFLTGVQLYLILSALKEINVLKHMDKNDLDKKNDSNEKFEPKKKSFVKKL
jgi:hypothetical protein